MEWKSVSELFRTAKEHVLDKPQRLTWVVGGLFLFFLTHGQDAMVIGQATIQAVWDKKPDEWTLKLAIGVLMNVGRPFAWMAFCFFGSFCVSLLLHRYIVTEIAPGASSIPSERQRFLLEGVNDAGMFAVYQTDRESPIKSQRYADTMRAKLAVASRMRMLTIAGYEYIGKGQDSLLWEGVNKRKDDLDMEIVLLDADSAGGKACISSRLACLSQRDPSFDDEQMKEHIRKTVKTLGKLKAERKNFTFKLLSAHPLFRILILDSDMWISAYEATAHGHESKVFHFRKEGAASWFCAFEALYEQASQRAAVQQ